MSYLIDISASLLLLSGYGKRLDELDMTASIGSCFSDPPYHYERAEEITIVFRTDLSELESVLPPPLKPLSSRGLAVCRVVRHVRSTFGPYTGVYLGVPALLNGTDPVFHMLSGMKTSFTGVAAGREVWGMPLQVGEVAMAWKGNVMRVSAGRNGTDFVHFTLRLSERSEAPSKQTLSMGTFATRRQAFEEDSIQNVLIGLRGEVDLTDVRYWNANATLRLVGGESGDDWSLFPVHEVVAARYNSGGQDTLNRGVVVAEW